MTGADVSGGNKNSLLVNANKKSGIDQKGVI